MTRSYTVGIVGATGIAGQQFVIALQGHPWFSIERLAASERSAGRPFGQALLDPKTGARRWWCQEEPAAKVLSIPVENGDAFDPEGLDVVFSATESDVAQVQEPRFAKTTAVVSTASAFRYEADVPLLVPNVNMDHAELIHRQRKNRGWKGFVVPIPNCTVTGLVITLKPLADAFGLRSAIVTAMNGLSGAGRSPGVMGLDILDNIIPFIPKEEEKVQTECRKILPQHPAEISATCTRVNVMEGHTESVFAALGRRASVDEVKHAFRSVRNEARELGLPTAPAEWIKVHDNPFRPQPRLDRDNGGGMTTTVGRVREDNVLPNGMKYLLVSHNTRMGAAAGAVLVAEYLAVKGYLHS
ncbi:MAG: aspartate-semialdehyde dehydrogenase [Candidatus Rokuibacteriota bacterium]|nr:MAG: aspartate-semialdehyde dehydrogenase [Candidatus Rokubacteria bacterium]